MEIVRCSKGHYYDASRYKTCPNCEKADEKKTMLLSELFHNNRGNSSRKNEPVSETGKTVPLNLNQTGKAEMYQKTVPLPVYNDMEERKTVLLQPETQPATAENKVQHYSTTVPLVRMTAVQKDVQPESSVPCAAILVCISGAKRGREYRVLSQMNYIGRAGTMDICISDDESISAENAAVIGYDHENRVFSFGPGSSHNIIRVNGRMIIGAEMLKPYDRVTIGKTELLFVPICGEWFDWNEEQK